ncbi:MAG: WXG100 family type VII secretion target, partial [Oscillochloris sp.]|nr:WXG100 family type VII secretion target [Oscillochloris sp.]
MSVVPTGYAGSVVRADTDQLRAVARQMRATADQITGGHDGMQQSMSSLDATWSGHARDRGMARWGEIAPKYRPSAVRHLDKPVGR